MEDKQMGGTTMSNNNTKLQFTKLNPNDVIAHEDNYTTLLMNDKDKPLGEKMLELPMAKRRFWNTFK